MIAFLVGFIAFLGAATGWVVREHLAWQRRPPQRVTLPVWDGLPRKDLAALPALDPWDPRLRS